MLNTPKQDVEQFHTYTNSARVKASQEGLRAIDHARKRKGWAKNSKVWYHLAFISESTLKRFWRQNRICVNSFIGICAAVGIDDWETIVDWSE